MYMCLVVTGQSLCGVYLKSHNIVFVARDARSKSTQFSLSFPHLLFLLTGVVVME